MSSSFLPKYQPKISRFLPNQLPRIVAIFFGDFFVSVGSFFGYDPCLFGRAEILVIFGLHFGRNDDLINSFWIQMTFSHDDNCLVEVVKCSTFVNFAI